jgi:hypothetical protein
VGKAWHWIVVRKSKREVAERMTRGPGSLFDRMCQRVIVILALNTHEQMLSWHYFLMAYCQLEALTLELL